MTDLKGKLLNSIQLVTRTTNSLFQLVLINHLNCQRKYFHLNTRSRDLDCEGCAVRQLSCAYIYLVCVVGVTSQDGYLFWAHRGRPPTRLGVHFPPPPPDFICFVVSTNSILSTCTLDIFQIGMCSFMCYKLS